MDTMVRLFAPHGPIDFVLKLAGILLVLGAMNRVRDHFEHGVLADNFLNNFWEAAVVGLLPSILALLLIGHLNRLRKKLAAAAFIDPLTSLPNRRHFFEKAEKVLPKPGGVLLMLDADHFKQVNDQLGHGAGDQCLIEIANLLRRHIRADDVVARLGGEEFGLLLVGARREDARNIGDCLAKGVVLDLDGMTKPHPVTLSIGAVCTAGESNMAHLFSRADLALYESKAAGRARITFAQDIKGPAPQTAIAPRRSA